MKEKLQLLSKFRNFNNKWNILYYRIKINTAQIKTNSNGRTGTQGDLGVTYSPNYGSQVVQEFTSSND